MTPGSWAPPWQAAEPGSRPGAGARSPPRPAAARVEGRPAVRPRAGPGRAGPRRRDGGPFAPGQQERACRQARAQRPERDRGPQDSRVGAAQDQRGVHQQARATGCQLPVEWPKAPALAGPPGREGGPDAPGEDGGHRDGAVPPDREPEPAGADQEPADRSDQAVPGVRDDERARLGVHHVGHPAAGQLVEGARCQQRRREPGHRAGGEDRENQEQEPGAPARARGGAGRRAQPTHAGPSSCLRSATSDGDGRTRSRSSRRSTLVRAPPSSRTCTSIGPGWVRRTSRSRSTTGGTQRDSGIETTNGPAPSAGRSAGLTSMATSFGTSSRRSSLPLTITIASSATSCPHAAYVAGKNSTSIAPSRSSRVAAAQGLPCLVTLRCTPDRMPPIVTTWPSRSLPPSRAGSSAASSSSTTEQSARAARACSMPRSGWSDTYRPSISRSKPSSVRLSHSPSGTGTSNVAALSSSPPNRESWPIASFRLTSITESMACSWIISSPRRGLPSESNAPALISDSTTRLLHTFAGTLRRKSAKLAKAPFSARAAMIDSTT